MFDQLTYKWGNTLFGCIAALMMPIPFVRCFVRHAQLLSKRITDPLSIWPCHSNQKHLLQAGDGDAVDDIRRQERFERDGFRTTA